ncbi:molybdopterin-guanine dinucleotide biosynthesis protein B [Caldalkalibacillus mannanilyticus]|uniref:molybdopterin-guanine dinucleotide biosynthesis protein B n=1 Tax=Caldalkalibacillus mannanilyticus TaxID=1418 RepID=UPI00046A49CF|nr:molybdopterin-guanine dinucleotide biosynthesis protein B [Caldalkalibacillus mannanilyticus]
MSRAASPVILQCVGFSNSGKTTLLVKIITHLKMRHHLSIATIKHDHHGFSLDQEGKDTWKHREAGADASLIQSPSGIGLTMKIDQEGPLSELLIQVQTMATFDLILIEGFKKESYPKIVLLRSVDDFTLILEAKEVKLLLFWNKQDHEAYKLGVQEKKYPSYESLLLQEEERVLSWVERCYTKLHKP